MTEPANAEKPTGHECRFAVYCPAQDGSGDDVHLIKERQHFADGSTKPNVKFLKNWRRPFWVTKKGMRNHQDKKEWERIEHLEKYEATQTNLVRAAARALGMPWFQGNDLRRLAVTPYLYGADILSSAVIKQSYRDQWKELNTPYSMAATDTETDVIRGTNEIQMQTISMGSQIFTAIQKSFVAGYSNVEERLQQLLVKYLSAAEMPDKNGEVKIVNVLEQRKIQWEIKLVDTEADVVTAVIQKAHEWSPDWLAIWNIDFDIPRMVAALDKRGINVADVFSDPRVPAKYRFFEYKQGTKKKVTASGKVMPIKPAAQWHTVFCPSSFYVIDAMCAYRQIRTGSQEEPSYALDNILKKHELGGKLKFEEADGLTGIDWHQFMQERHPLEYVVYNVFDCVSMEMLDEKTTDLSITLPLFAGCSDFSKFNSQPRRTADKLHYFCLENGRVIGTTSGEMATEFDKETIGLDGWIVTLPAHLVVDNGLQVIEEYPTLRTNIRAHVGDLDVSASYPNGGCVFNISKATTRKELIKIQGVSEHAQRMQGINLSAGHTNAVEIVTQLYGLPGLEQMLHAFQQDQDRTVQEPQPDYDAPALQ